MYSKELEAIIDAALADGALTDKEREVLHRRAAQEGVDSDELDVLIEGRLAKKKKEEDWLRPAPPAIPPLPSSSNKIGEVKKCPMCGEPYHQGTTKCPACGFEYVKSATKSSQQFAEEIQRLLNAAKERESRSSGVQRILSIPGNVRGLVEVRTFIRNFPIPSNRDDLLDFMVSMNARIKTGDSNDAYYDDYKAKLREAVDKARIFFANDPQFAPLLQQHQGFSYWWKTTSTNTKMVIVAFFILFIFVVITVIVVNVSN